MTGGANESGEKSKPYSYRFRAQADSRPESSSSTGYSLVSIKDALTLITGGCAISPRQDGYYCEKHQRYVKGRESRCDYLSERLATSQERSRAQVQQYVNDILGVKDPKLVKRLTGR